MRASRILQGCLVVTLAASSEGCVVFASIDDVSVPADETPGGDADASTAEIGVDSSAADVGRDSAPSDAADARADSDAMPDSRPRDSAIEVGDTADSSAGDAFDSAVDTGVDTTVDSGVDSTVDTADTAPPDSGAPEVDIDTGVDTGAVDPGDAAPEVVDDTTPPPCPGACAPGATETLTDPCPGAIEVMSHTCTSLCSWGPSVCAMPKGWVSIASPPAGFASREEYTAVWSGTDLLVWGGVSGTTFFSDGARYNLKSNSWTMMAPAPASLIPRAGHVAVWNGAAMMLWGGRTQYAGPQTGGAQYNPTTDTWTVFSAAPIVGRTNESVAWLPTTGELFIWGGNDGYDLNDGATYRAFGDTWTGLPSSPLSKRTRAIIANVGGDVLLWGGAVGDITAVNDGARYSAATRLWTSIPNPPATYAARIGPAAAALPNGFVSWGGLTLAPAALGDGIQFVDGVWTLITEPSPAALTPSKRALSTVWCNGTGTCWFWSGTDTTTLFAGGASLELGSGTWTAMPGTSEPAARAMGLGFWTGQSGLVWGGQDTASKVIWNGAVFTP